MLKTSCVLSSLGARVSCNVQAQGGATAAAADASGAAQEDRQRPAFHIGCGPEEGKENDEFDHE
ncbi:MAG: hypothetical protein Q8Q63_03020, partial [Phaeovulum sp.]|uniref:hypothetical protein n=1 Tax=Phaeovulum sp. TaxID=2934796 RepID=UPI002736B655